MQKTFEAYYKNGKIIYKNSFPKVKAAKLVITIVEEKNSSPSKLARFKGIFKKKIDGMAYQKKMRGQWR